jgi:hypothetical protein
MRRAKAHRGGNRGLGGQTEATTVIEGKRCGACFDVIIVVVAATATAAIGDTSTPAMTRSHCWTHRLFLYELAGWFFAINPRTARKQIQLKNE